MKEVKTLEEAVLERLQSVVRTKQGSVAVDEDGQPLTPNQAIAMSILSKAMKGDIQSATFVRNIVSTKSDISYDERERRHAEQIKAAADVIREELERDGLYLGQDTEIAMLAMNRVMLERVDEQMRQPEYQDLLTEYKKDGTTKTKLNPLHERWDGLQKTFLSDFKKLQSEARRIKFNRDHQ